MQTYGALFAHELQKAVEAKIEHLRTTLETPALEPGRLPFIQGQIAAFREVTTTMMDEAATAANQENR